jgi:ketosteroid isomerase-like protein
MPRLHPQEDSDQDIAKKIIALERAALDRSDKNDVSRFLEISDPGVSYFDPFLEKAIHGREELAAYYKKVFVGERSASGEMSNANVQVFGDFAVLTFNYRNTTDKDSAVRWNATEVYRLTRNGWRIVHTHWSLQSRS